MSVMAIRKRATPGPEVVPEGGQAVIQCGRQNFDSQHQRATEQTYGHRDHRGGQQIAVAEHRNAAHQGRAEHNTDVDCDQRIQQHQPHEN